MMARGKRGARSSLSGSKRGQRTASPPATGSKIRSTRRKRPTKRQKRTGRR